MPVDVVVRDPFGSKAFPKEDDVESTAFRQKRRLRCEREFPRGQCFRLPNLSFVGENGRCQLRYGLCVITDVQTSASAKTAPQSVVYVLRRLFFNSRRNGSKKDKTTAHVYATLVIPGTSSAGQKKFTSLLAFGTR